MIVEDNELNMKLFHDLLEAYGYRTIGTRDGFEVVDLARKRRPCAPAAAGYGLSAISLPVLPCYQR
jgi:CheY-like chemotaxis protein